MNTQNNIEERLWGFIDGTGTPDDKSIIEKLIQTDLEWKAKYQELLEVNDMLLHSELEAPSMRFTKNVMDEISKMQITPAAKKYINNKIIWGIGFFFITLVTVFLVYGFSQMEWTAGEATVLPVNLPTLDVSKFFNNNLVNAFMMINIVLGLFLLDNFLSNKRKTYRKEA